MVDDKLADICCVTIDSKYNSCGLELDLFSESLYDIFKEGKERVLHFVDEDANEELHAALKVGFKQIDSYRGYRLKIQIKCYYRRVYYGIHNDKLAHSN